MDAPAPWPLDGSIDVAELRESGWRPHPIRQFIFKIHSRCNLSCSYCFVYSMADQSWRGRPVVMTDDVVDAALERVREHVLTHNLASVALTLHGGEPLLAGPRFIRRFADRARSLLDGLTSVELSVQTNATLLDGAMVALLAELDFKVGVSLDGGPGENAARTYHSGKSSYERAATGIRTIAGHGSPGLFGGILCTIDLANDPLAVYEHLKSFGAPAIDFLLPHGSWEHPPPGKGGDGEGSPYADWLLPIFHYWYAERPATHTIRTFSDIMVLLLGGTTAFESLGLSPVQLVVVETDGSIEQVDHLKAIADGGAATDMSIAMHSFDDVLSHPAVAARQLGIDGLCKECVACPVVDVCGGGLWTHRFHPDRGFLAPSLFCSDLFRLIAEVRNVISADLDTQEMALSLGS